MMIQQQLQFSFAETTQEARGICYSSVARTLTDQS